MTKENINILENNSTLASNDYIGSDHFKKMMSLIHSDENFCHMTNENFIAMWKIEFMKEFVDNSFISYGKVAERAFAKIKRYQTTTDIINKGNLKNILNSVENIADIIRNNISDMENVESLVEIQNKIHSIVKFRPIKE